MPKAQEDMETGGYLIKIFVNLNSEINILKFTDVVTNFRLESFTFRLRNNCPPIRVPLPYRL